MICIRAAALKSALDEPKGSRIDPCQTAQSPGHMQVMAARWPQQGRPSRGTKSRSKKGATLHFEIALSGV